MRLSRTTLIKRIEVLEAAREYAQLPPPPPDAPKIEHTTYQIWQNHQDHTPLTLAEARELAEDAEALCRVIVIMELGGKEPPPNWNIVDHPYCMAIEEQDHDHPGQHTAHPRSNQPRVTASHQPSGGEASRRVES